MFTLTIKTDNAAFADDPRPEVARILRKLADRVDDETGDTSWSVRDINGNTVGHWTLTTED